MQSQKSASILNNLGFYEDSDDEEINVTDVSNYSTKLRKEWSFYLSEYALFANSNPVEFWLNHENGQVSRKSKYFFNF